MKTTSTKILAAVLFLSGCMPLMVSLLCAVNPAQLMDMFRIEPPVTPGLEKTMIVLGAAMLAAAFVQFIAGTWVWQGRAEGLTLSLCIGVMMIGIAAYMMLAFATRDVHAPDMYMMDLVKGILITALTAFVRRRQQMSVAA